MATYETVNEALQALDEAVKDVVRDQPHLAEVEDSVYWDLCQGLQSECTPAVARELARVTGVDLATW